MDNLIQAVREAVKLELDSEIGDKRYINLERVPLICQSIIRIDQNIQELKERLVTREEFTPVKSLVYGYVGIVVVAVTTALVMLVLKG